MPRKGLTKTSLITLNVLLVIYALALTVSGLDITKFVHEAHYTLLYNPDLSVTEKYQVATQMVFRLSAPADLLYIIEALLGDGIIIWRVWVLWGNSRRWWVILIPAALFVGSIVAMFLLGYCVVHLGTSIVNGSFQHPQFCKNVQTTTYIMPTVITAVTTILIGVKTWEYRKHIKPIVTVYGVHRSTSVERVLMLLVESGMIYFIFFLVIVIGNIPGSEKDPNISFAASVYSDLASVIVGMYPTIITLLSNSEGVMKHKAANSALATNDIHFATILTETTDDNYDVREAREGKKRDSIVNPNDED
ncbi:hypothetical protein H0H93_013942 [Arthromyces matolae]|nr:hypothetical protein H0H93_013942 [Arthromyces matolae]